MRILFTRNNRSLFSRTIQWATGWDVSHVALELEGMVFHSNLLGPQSSSLEEFERHCEIVRYITLPSSVYDAVRLFKFYLQRKHRSYDFVLFLYLGVYLIIKKAGNLPASPKYIHRVSGAYLCTEFVGEFITGNENTYMCPQEIWEEWKTRQE